LITGSNGLLGGFISNFLVYLNEEHSYGIKIILTSFSKKSNCDGVDITYVSQDLSNPNLNDSLSFILDNQKIDYCFYCAGYAQPFKFLKKNSETFFINTQGLHQILKKIFNNNKNAKSVFMSSAEVYATNDNTHSHKETDYISLLMDYKRNTYQLSKVTGEMISNNFRNLGYDSKSIRVSACYGPGQVSDDKRVMSDLVKKGFGNSPTINLLDDGKATRKYLHLSDFCVMLMNIAIDGKEKVYNVTGNEDITIHEMANHIGKWFNKRVRITDGDGSFAPKKVNISLNRYENEFGDIKFYKLYDGLNDYIKWFLTIGEKNETN